MRLLNSVTAEGSAHTAKISWLMAIPSPSGCMRLEKHRKEDRNMLVFAMRVLLLGQGFLYRMLSAGCGSWDGHVVKRPHDSTEPACNDLMLDFQLS